MSDDLTAMSAEGQLVDVDRLEFLEPAEATGWEFDIEALPELGSPVMATHTIQVSYETEQALRAEADRLGISVDELIVARIQRAA